MANVVSISSRPTRCKECCHSDDCPLTEECATPESNRLQSRIRVLHDRDRLFRCGDRVQALYRVRSGVVKTSLTGSDGSEQVTGFFGPGEWVGLDALACDRHACEASALDTVSVCVVPVPALRQRIAASPQAAKMMMSAMSRRLLARDRTHMSLARDNAVQRLAGFLLDLANERGRIRMDDRELALPMSRGEMASYLALAVETVSRLLTRMHKTGTVRVHRNRVEIVDPDGLAALAGRESAGRAATFAAGSTAEG